MIPINSEGIKSAVGNVLHSIAPDVAIYKESRSNPTYPNFFIYQISATDDESIRNVHTLTYSLDVYYRVASDPSTDLKLQTDLDDMGLKLFKAFNIIPYGDDYIKCMDKKLTKVDGVLHFTFKLYARVRNVDMTDYPKLNGISVNIRGN